MAKLPEKDNKTKCCVRSNRVASALRPEGTESNLRREVACRAFFWAVGSVVPMCNPVQGQYTWIAVSTGNHRIKTVKTRVKIRSKLSLQWIMVSTGNRVIKLATAFHIYSFAVGGGLPGYSCVIPNNQAWVISIGRYRAAKSSTPYTSISPALQLHPCHWITLGFYPFILSALTKSHLGSSRSSAFATTLWVRVVARLSPILARIELAQKNIRGIILDCASIE